MNPSVSADIPPKTENLVSALIIAAFAAIVCGYALGGPLFAADDEIAHFARIHDVARTGNVMSPSTASYEFFQAPLYYVMAASLVRVFSPDVPPDFDYFLYVHFSSRDNFPSLSPVAQVARLVRLISAGLGLVTLLGCLALFHNLWPDHPLRRLLALGIVAFWPQFQFQSGAVTNDILIYCTTTWCLAHLMHMARYGCTLRSSLWLGALLGVAMLAKASGVLLLIPVAVSAFLISSKQRGYIAVALVLAVCVSGWWYLDSWLNTGDPTNQAAMYQLMPGLRTGPEDRTILYMVNGARNIYSTMWVSLGMVTIRVDKAIFHFYDLWMLIGCLGLIGHGARQYTKSHPMDQVAVRHLFLAGSYLCALAAAVFIYITMNWLGYLGRFVLPGIGLIGAGLALGLASLMPSRLSFRFALSLICLDAAVSLIIQFGSLLPVLRLPTAAAQNLLTYTYGGNIELVNTELTNAAGRPGDTVLITLDWRALHATDSSLGVRILSPGPGGASRRLLFASGNLLSHQWRAGELWREVYYFKIPPGFPAGRYPLVVYVIDRDSNQLLPVADGENQPINTPYTGYVIVLPQ